MISKKFNDDQKVILQKCVAAGYVVDSLRDPEIEAAKMEVVYQAFGDGINLIPYIHAFTCEQLEEIRLGLYSRIDITEYAHPQLTAKEMHIQRVILEDKQKRIAS